MLINYKSDAEGRMLVVPVVTPVETTNVGKQDAYLVMEGWNEIDPKDWPFCVGSIKEKIESGEIELACKEEKDDITKEVKYIDMALYDVRADKARAIVKGCYNEKNLRAWVQDTKVSSELRALCDMQIMAIERGNEVTR